MWFVLLPLAIVLAVLAGAVGLLVALLSGVVGLVGAVAQGAPWLFVIAGLWLLMASGRDSRRQRARHARRWDRAHGRHPVRVPVRVAEPPSAAAEAPVRAAAAAPELPIDVQVKVEQIRRKVEVLLSYADRFGPFSQDLHIVQQTAHEYLPRTLEAYRALPAESAESVVLPNGKTAASELREQLHLLDTKLDEIATDLQRRDAERLLANRRFLEDRFERTSVEGAA